MRPDRDFGFDFLVLVDSIEDDMGQQVLFGVKLSRFNKRCEAAGRRL